MESEWTDADETALQKLSGTRAALEMELSLRLQVEQYLIPILGQIPEGLELPDSYLREILKPVSSVMAPHQEILAFPVLPYLANLGIRPTPEVELVSRHHDIYILSYGVDVEPRQRERITGVGLRLGYPTGGYLSLELSPTTQLEELARVHADVQVALSTDLKLKTPIVEIPAGGEIGAGMEASASAGFAMHWRYRALRARVVAWGEGNAYARWRVYKPEAAIAGFPVRVLLRAPKGVRAVPIRVEGTLEVKHFLRFWRRTRKAHISSKEPLMVKLDAGN
jgi:hypothetical protein